MSDEIASDGTARETGDGIFAALKKGQVTAETKITYFRHPMLSAKYGFRKGGEAAFVNHFYATSNEAEIAELREEAKHLNLTETEEYISAEDLADPVKYMRTKFYREFLQEQAAGKLRASNLATDAGSTTFNPQVSAMSSVGGISADAIASAQASAAQASQPESGGATKFTPTVPSGHMATLIAKMGGKK